MRNVLQNEDSLKNITTKSAALISFLLVLPFAVLEGLNNTTGNTLGLIVLFGLLWLLPVVFILLLVPTVRKARANSLNLLFRVTLLVVLAMMWGGILVDQMPCFLGVPNCD